MFLYLVLIIAAALLQTTVVNLNLCLILIMVAAFLRRDNLALYLSLIGGLSLGLLSGVNIGFYPLVFLVISQASHLYKRLPVSGNVFFALPAALVALLAMLIIDQIYLHQTANYLVLPLEMLLFLLAYLLAQFFEDHFSRTPDLRLRLR